MRFKSNDRAAPASPQGERLRRRLPRIVFFIAFALFTIATIILAPLWFPLLPGSDENFIAYERAQRLGRASLGLPMPGAPDTTRLLQRLTESGLQEGAPILIRIFKREFELELWMKRDGVFQRFTTYPICRWSGGLGPKLKQGDGQAPEGFYSVDVGALNPNSAWYRSFNLGYPNAFDAAQGRTGSLIMVHGGCASVGCFAMTNPQIAEIWQLVTAALQGGQKRFQVQVYPFRMTDERLQGYAGHPNLPFWQMLKRGNDLFEASHLPPRVNVCKGAYGFEPAGVYPSGDGGIENRCPDPSAKS
jgi:murein L,D-transpeptidase YafK